MRDVILGNQVACSVVAGFSRLIRGSFTLLVIFCLVIPIQDVLAEQQNLPSPVRGTNLDDCARKLERQQGGWCEIRVNDNHPSISSVWPKNPGKRIRMRTGGKSILTAWNSAAFDEESLFLYFFGGGHADYGGNEVYRFDLRKGSWKRLTDPTPLDQLFILHDYGARKNKPWRRLCWMPDPDKVPGSSHTYDGLIFSKKTKTVFLYTYGAANGSCLEDKEDEYRNSPLVRGSRRVGFGWYEFNPSESGERNGISPLKWRKVFGYDQLKQKNVHQSYPVSIELTDGNIVFGSKLKTVIYDPANNNIQSVKLFTGQADWGDGLKVFDERRNQIWSIHKKSLLQFDAATGRLLNTNRQIIPHGKSIAINGNGDIVSWDGRWNIFMFDPDASEPAWRHYNWMGKGPKRGDRRVYGKWVYLKDYDLYAGISTHETGFWIYKHPAQMKPVNYAPDNLNELVKQTVTGGVLKVPPGIYGQGLFINRSMTVDLKGVSIRGVAKRKGIVNVSCNGCQVKLLNLDADGVLADCLGGNCAGIKAEGKGFELTVDRAVINNTVMGIMTDNRGGTIRLTNSLIQNSGLNDRSRTLGHGFYVGDIDKVVVENSIIRRSFGKGHLFKSRAAETEVINSVIAGLDGRHSRLIDFPCGGHLVVHESVLQQGEQTDNIDLISVGTEAKNCGGSVRPSNVSIRNNWIIFDRDESKDEPAFNYGFNRFFTWRAPIEKIVVSGNRIVETTGRFKFDGEDHVPDLSEGNKFYTNRKAAGLGPVELPERPGR